MEIKNHLRKIDQFGAEVGLSIQDNDKYFKTWIGGLTTVGIYSLGSIWFTYLAFMFFSGYFPMNSLTRENYLQEKYEYNLTGLSFAFRILSFMHVN